VVDRHDYFLQDVEEAKSPDEETKVKGKVVKFGWLDGVFVSQIY